MYSVTLAFGELQEEWSSVYSYEILEGVLTMLIYEYISKNVIEVELPKQYRLIITKKSDE